MKAINARATKDNYDVIDIMIEISDRNELEKLIKRLRAWKMAKCKQDGEVIESGSTEGHNSSVWLTK